MNKKHFFVPSLIFFIALSCIVLLVPIEIKNFVAFSIIFASIIFFNITSILIISRNIISKIDKDIYNIPAGCIYIIFNILLFVLLLISKIIYISTNVLMILLISIVAIYSILMYFLLGAKNYIIDRGNDKRNNIAYHKKWLTKIEIIKANNYSDSVNELYEKIKYMDPIQIEETKTIDEKIDKIFEEIADNVTEKQIENLNKLINERNIVLKNNK